MQIKPIILLLCASLFSFSGCATVESPEVQEARAMCGYLLEQSKTKWSNASLKSIYKTNPEMGKNQKQGLRGLSNAMMFCQHQIFKGSSKLEDRLALESIRDKINHHYTKEEEDIFFKRTAGKELCSPSLNDFLYLGSKKPSKKCIYPTEGGLVAQQVTDLGILAASWGMSSDKMLFLYRENKIDRSLVDGEAVQSGLFEYIGPFSYQSLLGQRTVHSFRRMNENPFEGLLFYGAKKSMSEATHKRIINEGNSKNRPYRPSNPTDPTVGEVLNFWTLGIFKEHLVADQ